MRDVRRVTIKDVARDAGVSVSTVSNWLSGRSYGLSPTTRERVEASVNRLGYRPSALARGLRGKSTRVIGLIVPSITNAAIPPIVRGAEDQASALGYSLFLTNVDRHWDRVEAQGLAMVDRGVEGVGFVFTAPSVDAAPVVAVERGRREGCAPAACRYDHSPQRHRARQSGRTATGGRPPLGARTPPLRLRDERPSDRPRSERAGRVCRDAVAARGGVLSADDVIEDPMRRAVRRLGRDRVRSPRRAGAPVEDRPPDGHLRRQRPARRRCAARCA